MMSREKQIEEFANSQVDCEFFDNSLYKGIIIGAKWADKNPDSNGKELLYVVQKTAERTKKEVISKACEWLEEKNKMCMYELEMILGDKFINDFKKAMEV